MTKQEPRPRSVGHDRTCNRCGQTGIECKLITAGEASSFALQFQHSCGCTERGRLSIRRSLNAKKLVCPLCDFDHGKTIFGGGSATELTDVARALNATIGVMFVYLGLQAEGSAGMSLGIGISAPFLYLAYTGRIKTVPVYRLLPALSAMGLLPALSAMGCVVGLIGKLVLIGLIVWALAATVLQWLTS